MPLKRSRYLIELPARPEDDTTDETVVHELTILPADQLVAEQRAPRLGIGSMRDAPIHYSMLWMHIAAVRSGVYSGDWQQFRQDLVAYDDPDKNLDLEDRPELDPTKEAGTSSR